MTRWRIYGDVYGEKRGIIHFEAVWKTTKKKIKRPQEKTVLAKNVGVILKGRGLVKL